MSGSIGNTLSSSMESGAVCGENNNQYSAYSPVLAEKSVGDIFALPVAVNIPNPIA